MRIERLLLVLAMMASLAFVVAACGDDDGSSGSAAQDSGSSSEELSGSIRIDGSSTVYPFAQAAAELFNEDNPDVKINVGESGTGGGFEKFCAGETDISDASRGIEADETWWFAVDKRAAQRQDAFAGTEVCGRGGQDTRPRTKPRGHDRC